ncbi:histidine kinase [Flavobacteriales bacterium]|nr:histidine kinase [Flavobacteriales bacterium]
MTGGNNVRADFKFNDTTQTYFLGEYIEILVDTNNTYTADELWDNKEFYPSHTSIVDLGISQYSHWLRFTITNTTNIDNIFLNLAYPLLDEVTLYEENSDKVIYMGDRFVFSQRKVEHQHFIFDANIQPEQSKTFLLKVSGGEQILVPLKVGSSSQIYSELFTKDVFFGIYVGVMLAMALYNVIAYLFVWDRAYLYYVVYVVFACFAQLALDGYMFKYVFANTPDLANAIVPILGAIGLFFMLVFFRTFLETKARIPNLDKLLYIPQILLLLTILVSMLNYTSLAFNFVNLAGGLTAVSILVIGLYLVSKGVRSAKVYMIAWSLLLIGIIIFALQVFGILPNNIFTNYTILFGTAAEVILLTVALFDRFNTVKQQKEKFQNETISMLREKSELMQKFYQLQTSPHFIFNGLNSIQSYILDNDKKQSYRYLTVFSQLMRSTLDNSSEKFITLKNEFKFLDSYLTIEENRLKNKLSWNVCVSSQLDLDKIMIPPMLLQPIIENSIWHGIANRKEGGLIQIKVSELAGKIDISIVDDGVGREATKSRKVNGLPHKSYGIGLVEERIKVINKLYSKEMSVVIVDLKSDNGNPLGTEVRLSFRK